MGLPRILNQSGKVLYTATSIGLLSGSSVVAVGRALRGKRGYVDKSRVLKGGKAGRMNIFLPRILLSSQLLVTKKVLIG